MITDVYFLEMLYYTSSVKSGPLAAQVKLAVWLVVVVEIAVAMEFFGFLFMLSGICFLYFSL